MALSGEPIPLRPARPEDVPALADLLEAVGAERLWIASEPPLDRRRFAFQIRAFIERESHLCLVVAAADGTLAGELTAWPDGDRSATIGMCVAHAARRRGLGSMLLDACIAWARERGLTHLNLQVFPHNHAARELYRRFGFVETGSQRHTIRRRNGDLWDTLSMRLDLGAV
ncbi:MAG: GNAT family N-acetyltransferase [bacterium]|nr:GNAT family N-acetyltransferase [bacterium]